MQLETCKPQTMSVVSPETISLEGGQGPYHSELVDEERMYRRYSEGSIEMLPRIWVEGGTGEANGGPTHLAILL